MTSTDRSDWIVAQARALGFDLCGIAPAADFPELAQLPNWLARGYAGQMRYLHDPRRRSPQAALPGARSIIVCALNYNTPLPYSTDARAATLAGLSPDSAAAASVTASPRTARAGENSVADTTPRGVPLALGGPGLSRFGGAGLQPRHKVTPRSAHLPALRPTPEAERAGQRGAAAGERSVNPSPGSAPSAVTSPSSPRGWISRYAWGDDYHHILGSILDSLLAALRRQFADAAPFDARAYVDTGPVHERVAAHHAGLGWLGKNTCLIHQHLGSWLFLGVILTTLELAPSLSGSDSREAARTPPLAPDPSLLPPDLCGQCTQCLDACPTGALVEPYVLDARRCISYLTIELRGAIPAEFHSALGWHVFGCDICQDVCPFNRRAPVTSDPRFLPRLLEVGTLNSDVGSAASDIRPPISGLRSSPRHSALATRHLLSNRPITKSPDHPIVDSLFAPSVQALAVLQESEFRKLFKGSAIKRTKHAGLTRNASIALQNSQ